jgi:ABC-2 type transport system permease protein
VSNVLALGVARSGLEVRQFLRNGMTLVFSLAYPVMMLVIFGAIFDYDVAPGVPFTQYFVAGMIATGLLGNSFQTLGIQIAIERDRGVLKRLAGTPMPRAAYFVGKIIMVLVFGVLEEALLLAIGAGFYGLDLPSSLHAWLTLVWVSLLGLAACTLCGIAISSLPRDGKQAAPVISPIALVLQFISGVFFVFTQLPGWMQGVASVFPLRWLAQGLRSVFLPDRLGHLEAGGGWHLGTVAAVLGAWVVVGLLLCLVTFRWTRRDGG